MSISRQRCRGALPDVRIGSVRLGTKTAAFVEDTTGAGGSFDGIIGPTALQVRRIVFDYERQEFGWDR